MPRVEDHGIITATCPGLQQPDIQTVFTESFPQSGQEVSFRRHVV
jgi:hypothetical protein